MNKKEEIKALWRECFPSDSNDFVNLYFEQKYADSNSLIIQRNDRVAAALQMLPYDMTFGDDIIRTRYLSGCCTRPEHRNQGLMSELIKQSLMQMAAEGVWMAELIPAEKSLFDYYARFGFATVFGYESILVTDQSQPSYSVSMDKLSKEYNADNPVMRLIPDFIDSCMRQRPYCLQHTVADYKTAMNDISLSGGFVLASGANIEGKVFHTGLVAFFYPRPGNHWIAGDYLTIVPNIGIPFFNQMCSALKMRSLEVRHRPQSLASMTPLGMGRIINAFELLKRYAATHPEADECISVVDPLISDNNAAYLISDGQCLKSKHSSAKIKNMLKLSINELALWIFGQEVPYMSLMLNL